MIIIIIKPISYAVNVCECAYISDSRESSYRHLELHMCTIVSVYTI